MFITFNFNSCFNVHFSRRAVLYRGNVPKSVWVKRFWAILVVIYKDEYLKFCF